MISICVPTYNGHSYISDCINSIFVQTFRDFELLISDDSSTDDTLMIIQRAIDPRVKIYQNNAHVGLVDNWNRCLELAIGDPIIIFHQDDVMEPNAIEKLTTALTQNPGAGYAFSNIRTIDQQGKITGGHWNQAVLPQDDELIPGKMLLELILTNGNFIPCQTVMVRRICYQTHGRFDPRLRLTPDLEMWMRLALHYDAFYIQEPLIYLRRHPAQESSRFQGADKAILEVWRAFWIQFHDRIVEIPNGDQMYALGLQHLLDWSKNFFISYAKKGNVIGAARLIPIIWNFYTARRVGIMNMPAFPVEK